MELILKNYLNQPKVELGDRTEYIGASDVGQCPRKVVLSKTQPVPYDLQTLIRFERGNLVERIVENAFNHSGIRYALQVEVIHPEFNHLKAHLDFMFSRQNEIAVLETKSVSKIPDAPYPSWIQQIHFQMGLVALNNSSLPVRGALLVIDLSSGEFHVFNDYSHNPALFKGLVEKAEHIWEAVNGDIEPYTEKDILCTWCPYQKSCPEYLNQDLVDLPIEREVEQYLSLKENEKAIKANVDLLKAIIQKAVKPYGEAKVGEHTIKLVFSTRTSLDTKSLMSEHPEICELFNKTSTFNRLYVS
jgi:CRISPR/Cas system-associated exonuclease Cas4 (RecB family)